MTNRYYSLLLASGVYLGGITGAIADDALFNSKLLTIDHPTDIDIHQFNRANALPPGDYNVDIVVNDKLLDHRTVTFVQDKEDEGLHPCFVAVKEALASLGFKVDAIKSLSHVDANTCVNPVSLVEGAKWRLDADKLVLSVSIPQIYMDIAAHDYISPARWDEGINALMMNYDFSGTHTVKSDYDEDDSYFLNLQNGLNMGPWRLRNYSTLSSSNGGDASYDSISTYLQRNIAALRSQIMVGDTWTASDVFDSTRVRGVRLYTDDDMLPSSQNGFAPSVRGIAKSNATVIIKQSGYVIYQSAVPQGAFEITDLNTTSSGGDLDVTIKEEDGSEQHFTQPYSSLAILKREGQTDVDISIGEMRDESNYTPNVLQAQILHGMPWGLTLYGGVQAAEDYTSAALGIGEDLGSIGAISFDVSQASASFDSGGSEQGQSYRFLYSKRFEDTNTSFRLVGYRYSTEGYYTLNEWASRQDDSSDFWDTGNRRSRLEGTWTQSFADGWGSIYLTLSRQEYWKTEDVERMAQLGYNNYWNRISWSVSWSYTRSASGSSYSHYDHDDRDHDSNDESEQLFMLSISVPLSGWMDRSYVNYSLTNNNHGDSTHNVGLSGTLTDRNNLTYNLQQSYLTDGQQYGGNAGLTYDGTYGSVNGSYDWSGDSQRLNYGAKGGVLVHSDGVTLSQELGETVALIKAPGAEGLEVENATGVSTDWRGYTVKTQMNPYSENRVAINGNYYAKSNVELENSVINVVPTRGAVVRTEFMTHVGYRVLFNVRLAEGKPAPFGAMATAELASGAVTGIVGDNGDLYLSGMPEEGDFTLDKGNGSTCKTHYHLPVQQTAELIQLPVDCK